MTRRTLLTLAGLLVLPGFVLAHEGHNHKLMGVVSVVNENHHEVQDAKGTAAPFTRDDSWGVPFTHLAQRCACRVGTVTRRGAVGAEAARGPRRRW